MRDSPSRRRTARPVGAVQGVWDFREDYPAGVGAAGTGGLFKDITQEKTCSHFRVSLAEGENTAKYAKGERGTGG